MRACLKILFINCILLVTYQHCNACGSEPPENDFRVCSFDGNLLNFNELNAFTFHAEYLNGDITKERYNWKQNIDQWHSYCASTSVNKADIYHALYSGNKDFANNSFILFIKKNRPEAYNYLNALLDIDPNPAFTTDKLSVFHSAWDEFSGSEYNYFERQHSATSPSFQHPEVLDHIKNCKDAFIKKRWAYQAIVAAYYQSNGELVRELFDTYFTRKNRTWLDNSAQHYVALLSPENQKELLLECIIHGYDKITRNIELLTYSDGFNEAFASSLSDTTRSYYYFVKCIREYGRGLPWIKKMYALHPDNKYLDFLLNREVNKIENWLLKPNLVSSKGYFIYQKEEELPAYSNYRADVAYAKEFAAFVRSIKGKSLYKDLVIAYTEHLAGTNTIKFDLDKYKATPNQYVQAKIIDFLINFEKKSKSGEYKEDLLYIFNNAATIDKDESIFSGEWDVNGNYILRKNYMRQQLARNLGIFMTKFKKHRAEGFLLTGKSQLPQNRWYPFYGHSIYLNLYNKADVDDCLEIVKIIREKSKDKYIQFLQQDDINHEKIHYCSDYAGSAEGTYDDIKILDIAAQKLVSQDKLQEAYAIYQTFPSSYWENNCNEMPFVLNMHNPINPLPNSNQHYFNKLTFLEQFISYKQLLNEAPEDPYLNFYVANAYLSISKIGCFWYIKCPYIHIDNFEEERELHAFDKSAYYYEKVVKHSRNNALTAASLMALNTIGHLNQKILDTKKYLLYKDVLSNCDIYNRYLHSLTDEYWPTIDSDTKKIILRKFENFDKINF